MMPTYAYRDVYIPRKGISGRLGNRVKEIIEKVQEKALKMTGLVSKTYEERQKEVEIEIIESIDEQIHFSPFANG
jgi:hypothetical protein